MPEQIEIFHEKPKRTRAIRFLGDVADTNALLAANNIPARVAEISPGQYVLRYGKAIHIARDGTRTETPNARSAPLEVNGYIRILGRRSVRTVTQADFQADWAASP